MVLVIVALLVPVLLGTLALIIDNGYLYAVRRDMQTAADAGAAAAVQEIRRGNLDYASVALKDAERNGFKAGSGVSVSVNTPPLRGRFASNTNYVEITVHKDASLFFARALHVSSVPIEARAVAGLRPRKGCIYVLNPTLPAALDIGGSAEIRTPNCTVQVNSASALGASTSGSSSLRALATQVVGSFTGVGFTPSPETGIASFTDPLAEIPAPTVGSCTYSTRLILTSSATLNPGTYCGGIEVRKGTATLNPGNYILRDGGIDVQTNGSITGNGVMFYNTYSTPTNFAPFNIVSSYTVNLKAPSSGTYRGMLFFQDRRVTTLYKNWITRNDTANYEGFFYFPSSPLRFTGGSSLDVTKIVIIADTLELRGKMTIAGTGDDFFPAVAGDVRVVE